jgi:5-enolpyruvylshikimate-3-phosphate synthase
VHLILTSHQTLLLLLLLRPQDSDDIRYMAGALKALGIQLEENWEEGLMTVHGCGGRFPAEVRHHLAGCLRCAVCA